MTFESAKPLAGGHRPWLLFLAGAVRAAVGRAVPRAGGGHRLSDTADTVVRRRAASGLSRGAWPWRRRGGRDLRGIEPCGDRPHLPAAVVLPLSASLHDERLPSCCGRGCSSKMRAVPMIAGDVLLGASLAAAGYLWWLAFSGEPPRGALPSARARAARRQHRLCRAQPHAARHSAAWRLLGGARRHGTGAGGAARRKPQASSGKAHPGTGEDKTPLAADVLRSAEVKSAT